MKLSTQRILTTHVGSLPRSGAVVEQLLIRERGERTDDALYDRTMRAAVSEIVRQQVATGIDSVSDGETSKISYATYMKDRLSGFGGDHPRLIAKDLQPFADFRERMAVFAGKQTFKRQACIGPIAVIERETLRKDIDNLRAAVAEHRPHEAFMNSASPGVISAFQPNHYYPTHEAYVEAIGAAMQEEYEAIANAGLILQLDCPDLAMARHTGFQQLSEEEFLKRAEHQVEVLNHALRNIPAESLRMHVCWGNYEGPHDHDIPLAKIVRIVLKAKPMAILFEASNPRHAHEWTVWRDTKIPEDKVLVPGLLTSTSNYVEHPELIAQRIQQFADIVGRERVIAGTDCGFGTFAGIGKMDAGISWLKLAALVEGARLASARLWR
ncbi:MAG TPA: cobalamin-independent methionine synthase II family protein [Steroidobacteraceae bacterium]|jgi:5-methyltetrahydropteroyltriglutamate--homocysteine methyltransferase|nr:cobalamin-independent methionine synthase II family protein [Steroidobacteraceae bacterium]